MSLLSAVKGEWYFTARAKSDIYDCFVIYVFIYVFIYKFINY